MILSKKVFLSYATPDFEAAKKLYDDLRHAEVDVWLDRYSILPGQLWKEEIKKAINTSKFFLMLLSENSINQPGYLEVELDYEFEKFDEISDEGKILIPVRLNEFEINNARLRKLSWINLSPDWESGVKKIIEVIK